MLSARSCSPNVMNSFCPVIRHVPSSAGAARVVSAPTSEPACGSVRFIVPVHSPVTIFGRYSSRCSSLPWCSSMSIAPWVNSGHSEKAMLAAVISSCRAMPTSHGKPPPLYSGGNGTAGHPAST